MNFKTIITAVVAAIFPAVFASAQEQNANLRFLSFPALNESSPLELLVGEEKTIQINTPSHELSSVYRVPALSSVVVGETVTDSEGEKSFKSYGQAKAIAAKDQIILLLRRGKQNSDGFVVIPINSNTDDFKGGSFFFINTSSLVIKGSIGNSKIDMVPGSMKILTPTPNFANNICQVTLAYVNQDKEKRFFDTRWPANKNVRSMVIFFQNPETGRIGLAPITDIIAGGERPQP